MLKATQDLLAPPGLPGLPDQPDSRDLQDQKVIQDLLAHKDQPDHRVFRA